MGTPNGRLGSTRNSYVLRLISPAKEIRLKTRLAPKKHNGRPSSRMCSTVCAGSWWGWLTPAKARCLIVWLICSCVVAKLVKSAWFREYVSPAQQQLDNR